YDSSSHTVIGLLVRRPNGTWDPIHEVDRVGTRPVVLLNEEEQQIRVLYTASVQLDDIYMKASSTSTINFGSRNTVLDGSYNNVTSTKDTWTNQVVVMAASSDEADHAMLSQQPGPGEPVAAPGSV